MMSTTDEGQRAADGVAIPQMLKALQGYADGHEAGPRDVAQEDEPERDGIVDFWEFFEYFRAETDRLTRRIRGFRQTPKVSPEREYQNFFAVPIGKYEESVAGD